MSEGQQHVHKLGVSVVVCTYNGSRLLPQTLACLAVQEFADTLEWEIIVVDNNCTDATRAVVESSCWKRLLPVPIQLVAESTPGLAHARQRGVDASSYGFVAFVDDDNWLRQDWVQTAFDCMVRDKRIGACGGVSEAVTDADPPSWFQRFAPKSWGAKSSADDSASVHTVHYLHGAGLCVRKECWAEACAMEDESLTVDRCGQILSSGGDTEMCFRMRLLGWKLVFTEKLHLRHFIPRERMKWSYFRRLYQGFGISYAKLMPYRILLGEQGPWPVNSPFRCWLRATYRIFRELVKSPGSLLSAALFTGEGNGRTLEIDAQYAALKEFVTQREAIVNSCRRFLSQRQINGRMNELSNGVLVNPVSILAD